MKPIFLAFFITLLTLAAHAQDKIYKKDGAIISAKVTAVSKTRITYKLFADTAGAEYTIMVSDVGEIIYQNHTVDFFDTFGDLTDHSRPSKPKDTSVYRHGGKNIFAITPIAYTSAINGTINDAGIGVSYECLLGSEGHIGLNIPLMLAFSSPRDFDNGYGSSGTSTQTTSVYFMPGIKFYPAPDDEKVRYSIGASFFAIYGDEPEVFYLNNSNPVYNPSTGTYTYPNETGTYHYSMYGLMISNSVNITVIKHLYLAADLGAGFPLSDNRAIGSLGNGLFGILNDPFIQLGFKVGYRY